MLSLVWSFNEKLCPRVRAGPGCPRCRVNAAHKFHGHASYTIRAKVLPGLPAPLALLAEAFRETLGRMTPQQRNSVVAYIADYLRGSEPSNVPATPARSVEATPPPPESSGELRPAPASAKARGAMGWTPERREAMAKRAAARNAAKANSQSSPKANPDGPKANSQSYQSSPKAPEGGRGGWSPSPSGSPSPASSPVNPSNSSSSPSQAGNREAQSQPKAPQSSEVPKATPPVRHKIEVPRPPPPPRERREEEGSKDEGGPRTGREEAWHLKAYVTAVRAAYGRPWALDGKGQGQVATLVGDVWGGWLDGSTPEEAEAWYREQARAYVTRSLEARPDLKFFRPEQFHGFLCRNGPIPHAAAERRKATARAVQAKLREEREGWEVLPDEVTHEVADGALAALASCFPGQLKGPRK